MITDIDDLVSEIENLETSESERERLISKLNVYGYSEEKINNAAWTYWRTYFAENLIQLLQDSSPIVSHLLNDVQIKECFTVVFEEYKNRKKDLGIDDIRKFWTPI